MNHILTDERNRMNVSTLKGLLFITVNGPDVRSFPAQKFAEMWIKEGRHAVRRTGDASFTLTVDCIWTEMTVKICVPPRQLHVWWGNLGRFFI